MAGTSVRGRSRQNPTWRLYVNMNPSDVSGVSREESRLSADKSFPALCHELTTVVAQPPYRNPLIDRWSVRQAVGRLYIDYGSLVESCRLMECFLSESPL